MDNETKKPQAGGETRREFIRKSSLAAAAVATGTTLLKTPVYGQTTAPSAGRVLGANDRITVGVIGVGGQGMALLRAAAQHSNENNVTVAAVCDIWDKRRRNAQNFINGAIDSNEAWSKNLKRLTDADVYSDHRKLLERKDIDAVFIATVDHWHTRIGVDAMEAGKDLYVEKPMTRYLDEAFTLHDAVKRTGRILTVGSQYCSDGKFHKAAELIRAGKLGPLVLGQASYMRNAGTGGEWNYGIDRDATPDTLDWKRWLGPVSDRPFDADAYFRWRKYYPYCAGLLGDLLPHRLHPLMLATGNPEFPRRVVCLGTRKISTDRDVPDTTQLLVEFPSGYNLMLTSSTVNGVGLPDMIRGHHGTLELAGNRVNLRPERPFSDDVDPELHENIQPGVSVPAHQKNWFDCIRSRKAPNGNIDLAVRVQTVVSLAEMSERLNTMCLFDEQTRRVTNGDGRTVTPISYGTLPLS
jgi:predicted dehydrogenase